MSTQQEQDIKSLLQEVPEAGDTNFVLRQQYQRGSANERMNVFNFLEQEIARLQALVAEEQQLTEGEGHGRSE